MKSIGALNELVPQNLIVPQFRASSRPENMKSSSVIKNNSTQVSKINPTQSKTFRRSSLTRIEIGSRSSGLNNSLDREPESDRPIKRPSIKPENMIFKHM